MRGPLVPIVVTVAVLALAVPFLFWGRLANHTAPPSGSADTAATPDVADSGLTFFCAAGMKEPIETLINQYNDEYNMPVNVQFGGSGTLLSSLRVADSGDLYLAADNSYIEIAQKDGLVAEAIPLAKLQPVIIVPKGNPKAIAGVDDLTKEELRLGLASPEAASVGKVTQKLLTESGKWDAIKAAVESHGVFKPTVNDIANDVKIGAIDAAIVWDAIAALYPDLETVPLEGSENFVETVTVGVLTSSKHPTEALRFARYLAAPKKGNAVFAEKGFKPIAGDTWAVTPNILYFSGGVNRVAIEETLAEFAQREGCEISTIYNGCGILVGQMKTGEIPDVYHSCDITFMTQVTDLFEPDVSVSSTEMVIAVAQGNPKGIETLCDLGKPDLKVGVTNAEQSALGALTANLLRAAGCFDAVMVNVVSQTPTADLLVNQLRTGSLDAVVVYEANMTVAREFLDEIHIPIPEATATQTYAIAKNSEHKQITARLLRFLESKESVDRFISKGFHWLRAQ